jgi:hypothetical protein
MKVAEDKWQPSEVSILQLHLSIWVFLFSDIELSHPIINQFLLLQGLKVSMDAR